MKLLRPIRKQLSHHLLRKPKSHRHLLLFAFSSDRDSSIPFPGGGPVGVGGPIDAGSSIRKPISLWPGMYHSPVTNALWEARSHIFEKDDTTTPLVLKTPSQSCTSVLYKFSSDYTLREQYRNPWNHIRIGKLVEDLDALAGTIAFKVFSVFQLNLNLATLIGSEILLLCFLLLFNLI